MLGQGVLSESEMLLGLCLTPLAVTSLRANFDGTVLCSDANESGESVCISTGFSVRGKERVAELIADEVCHGAGGPTSALHGQESPNWVTLEQFRGRQGKQSSHTFAGMDFVVGVGAR